MKIKKIKHLKSFGIYTDFKWEQVTGLSNFCEKNVIYGWNYSGKTTLSRLFSSIEKKHLYPSYKDADIKIELSDGSELNSITLPTSSIQVKVFNSDYIRSNLKWEIDPSLEAIAFDVGENIEKRNKIHDNLKKIEKITGTPLIKGIVEQRKPAILEYEEFDRVRFTDEAKRIKLDVFNSLIEFTKAHFKTVQAKVVLNLDQYIIADQEKLSRIKQLSLASNSKSKLAKVSFESEFKTLKDKVKKILEASPAKTSVIESLENNSELYHWVQSGIGLHKDSSECGFCSNPITPDRVAVLNAYFSNAGAILREQIEQAQTAILSATIKDSSLNIPKSKNDFLDAHQDEFVKLQDEFLVVKERYNQALKVLSGDLSKKESDSLFVSMAASENDDNSEIDIQQVIVKLNELIDANNTFIDNFKTEQAAARETLKEHCVAKFLVETKYAEKIKRKNRAERHLQKLDKLKKQFDTENEKLWSELKSIAAGKTVLNDYIKAFLSRDDVTIDITSDEKFTLKRGAKLADNLSEGEKTAISFAYFLVSLESLNKEGKLIETIVFIDDPISSLDANHIAQVYSLLNSFFFRKGVDKDNPEKVCSCFKQLFISTHNFEFFSFLKDSTYLNKKKDADSFLKCEYYLVKRSSVDSSILTALPTRLRSKSEYVYLFELIYEFYEKGCPLDDESTILIPNALRRFFEMYSLIKLPGSNQEIDGRINALMGGVHQLKLLHHFSHFTTFEKLTKHDELIMNLPEAIRELLVLMKKDELHLNSLLGAIGKSISDSRVAV
jgi:wobble nucleotide-excising tRNase